MSTVTIHVLRGDEEIEVEVLARVFTDSIISEFMGAYGTDQWVDAEILEATRADTGAEIELTAAEEKAAYNQAVESYND